MKFHKSKAGLHTQPDPDGPREYKSYPPKGRLSLVQASKLLQERGLMQLPPDHDVLHSGVAVTRLKVYLSGEEGVWWCVKEGKGVPSYNFAVFPGETFGPFFEEPGSKKKEMGKTKPISCGHRRRGARKRRVGTVRRRQPAPKNKKWVVMDGRAVLRCRRGPRRGGARKGLLSACCEEERECSYVRRFSEGAFMRVSEAEGVKEQKSCPVLVKKETKQWSEDTRGQQLDVSPLIRKCCMKKRKTKGRPVVKKELTQQDCPAVPCKEGLKGGAPFNSKRLKLSDMQQTGTQLKLSNNRNDCFVNVGIQMLTKTCFMELPNLLTDVQEGRTPVSSSLCKLFRGGNKRANLSGQHQEICSKVSG